MRLANIPHLYLVRLKARSVLVRELFAVAGIAVGVALLFAALIASTSLTGSASRLTSGLVGSAQFQLRARNPQGFPETVLGEVERLQGVRVAVPVLEADVSVIGPRGSRDVDLIASNPRVVRLSSPLLRRIGASALAGEQALAVPTPVAKAIGAVALQVVKLAIGGRIERALIGTELTEASVGPLARSPLIAAPLSFAQRLTGRRGRITRIFVQARPGAQQQVRAELQRIAAGRLNVESANADAEQFAQAAAPVNQSTLTFAAICALVGFIFAYSAMLLTVELRRGLVEELRALGATRPQVVQTLLFDALVLGALASALGLVLGDLLSLLAFHSSPGYLAFAFPVGAPRVIDWQNVAIAVGAGLLAASVGALSPLRQIWTHDRARPQPRRARRRGGWAPLAFVAGLACLAGTTAILLAAPGSAILGIVLLLAALALLLPLLADAATELFDRIQRHGSAPSTEIAVAELRAHRTRTRAIAIAATGAVAVFALVTIQGSHANLQNGLERLVTGLARAGQVWVLAPGQQNTLATTTLSVDVGPKLSRLPGVRALGSYRAGFLEYGSRRVWVLAPPAVSPQSIPSSQLLSGGAARVQSRLRAGGWAVLSAALAFERHLRVGQRFTLPSANPIALRLAGTSTNLGWPPGAVVLNGRDYARAWGPGSTTAYDLMLAPGASARSVAREARAALGSTGALRVQTSRQREASQVAVSDSGLQRLTEIAALVLIAGLLAIVVSMTALIWQRRERFAAMKPQGITTGVLWAALVFESSLLLGAGCLTGAIFGVYGQALLSHALSSVTGFPVVFSAQLPLALASFALVAGVAAAILAVPGYRAAMVQPESRV
jgi:putative ABC transport system permease protein